MVQFRINVALLVDPGPVTPPVPGAPVNVWTPL
jgi:hypothetical protein